MECDRTIPEDVLDDLCSRFIINVPEEERNDLIRICFQIENAHWFYLDFYSKKFTNNRKPCSIKEFALQVFKHIPFLQAYAQNIDKIIENWKDYKYCVPTYGAILLNEDLSHVLLVQSYCSRSSWGFPKGKVNKDEPPHQCAIREVYEETGFDISKLINPTEYIEANVNDQVVRLYIIPGVNKDEKFEPKTRFEIKSINWFPLCDIPLNKKDTNFKLRTGTGTSAFFLVFPFLRKLRQWIFVRSQRSLPMTPRRPRHKSCGDIDFLRQRYSGSFDFNESVTLKEQNMAGKSMNDEYKDGTKMNTDLRTNNGMSRGVQNVFTRSEQGDKNYMENKIILNNIQVESSHCHVEKWTQDNQRYFEQTQKLRKLFWTQGKTTPLKSDENKSVFKEKDCAETVEIFHMENMTNKHENDLTTGDRLSNSSETTRLSENVFHKDSRFLNSRTSEKKNHTANRTFRTFDNIKNTNEEFQRFGLAGVTVKDGRIKERTEFPKTQMGEYFFNGIPGWVNFKFDAQAIIRSMEAAGKKNKRV